MKTFKILMALFLISFAAKAQQAGLDSLDRSILLSKGKSIRLNSNDNTKYVKIYNDGTNGVIDVSSGAVSIPDGVDLGTSNLNLASSLVFEGSTADAFETTLSVVDPTADQTWSVPNFAVSAAFLGSTLTTNSIDVANSVWGVSGGFAFEGSAPDANETTLAVTNPTADRTITFPDATITVSGIAAKYCGTTSSCAANDITSSARIASGQVPLVSGSPSTVTVTGLGVYGSTTSYACTVTNMTNQANSQLKVVNTSTTSITITGPNTITDTIAYICVGN